MENPHATRPSINKGTGNDATAYYNKDGSYVVKDNITDEIIQISRKGDPDWIPDSEINNPYKP